MDRDQRWERIEKAYDALILGEGIPAGNAVQAVKDAADIVTVSNAEAGVAHILERWF